MPDSTPMPPPGSSADAPARDELRRFAHPVVTAFAALVALALVLGRFMMTTPMWLDEALSVNIAALPLGDIAEALRHDGHPPLYYFLLHGWMEVFGQSNGAVRSLSAVISVLTLPLAYFAGKRIAGPRLGITALLVLATSPFAFRFGSETRMYSLLMLQAFAGYLLVTSALKMPKVLTLVGVSVVTASALWTQYWALWTIGAGGLCVLFSAWSAHRTNDPERRGAALKTAAALVGGGLLFLPWLPTMLYQNEHTGTPWAPSFRPTTLVMSALTSFTGGAYSEAQIAMLFVSVILAIAVFGRASGPNAIELRFTKPQRDTVVPGVLVIGTIAFASAVALVNGMAFAPRYAAVFYPFVVLLIALGIDRFGIGAARNVVIVSLALLSAAGVFFVVRQDRSQVGVAVEAIEQRAASGLVVACPDQLGPSLSRVLDSDRFELVAYPDLGDPRLVDWVDYAERNASLDPNAFAQSVLERAGDRPIFVGWSDTFLTLEGQCPQVLSALGSHRPGEQIVTVDADKYYEPLSVTVFPAPAAG